MLRTVEEGQAGEHRILVAAGVHRKLGEAGEHRSPVAAGAHRIDWEEDIVHQEEDTDLLVAAEVDRILHIVLAAEVVRRILVVVEERRRVAQEEGSGRPEAGMGCPVAAVVRNHIDLEVVGVDRSHAVGEGGHRSPVGRGLDTDCMT